MPQNQAILKRNEIPKEATWSTEDLFSSDDVWRESFGQLAGREEEIAAYQGRLGESGQVLLTYLKDKEALEEELESLYRYAMLKSDEDTRNPVYQAMKGQIITWFVQYQKAVAFETPELISITEERLEQFRQHTPELSLYRRYFQMKRRRKDHVLSPAEEILLAAAGEMADSPDDIYGNFVNADLTFPSVKDLEGNVYQLTNSTYISLMESSRERLRCQAFQFLYKTYDQFKNTAAAMLNAQVKQSIFFARARKYPSTRAAALDAAEMPETVYDNLIQAVHDNLDKIYRYTELRKKALGVEALHMYDLYAPIVGDLTRKVPFSQAKEEILAAMAVLGVEYCTVLEDSFDERWVDIYENEGKRSGAYSAGARVHPFILMNYKDNLNSEFTLAHELGHAMHSYLSNRHQPPVYADYVIFVAEVASICNEAILMQYLLKKTKDKKQRAYLINYFLEQFRTTLYRQTMFAEFEMKIHRLAETGEALTADVLKKQYYELNQRYYGSGMVIDPEIAVEWARIPHFYYNFYVYQYSTGFAAAMALSRKILTEGQPAVDAYLKFLSSGCSQDPISLLKIAGVDMASAEPVNQALEMFGELLNEMEELLEV